MPDDWGRKTYMTREDEEKLSSIKLYVVNNQILD